MGTSIDRKRTHVETNWKWNKMNVPLKYSGRKTYKIPKEAHLIKVSIIKYHTRTFSAQFQSHDLQIGLCWGFQNFATCQSASSKGDLLDKWVFADSLPNGVALIEKRSGDQPKNDQSLVKGMLIPYPFTMLTTPGGKPASLIRPASLSAVRGVISESWKIIKSSSQRKLSLKSQTVLNVIWERCIMHFRFLSICLGSDQA